MTCDWLVRDPASAAPSVCGREMTEITGSIMVKPDGSQMHSTRCSCPLGHPARDETWTLPMPELKAGVS